MATSTIETTESQSQQVTTYVTALQQAFSATAENKAARKRANEIHREMVKAADLTYGEKLASVLPLVFEWSASVTVPTMCLLAGIDIKSEQSVRYYIRGGRVASELVKDKETNLVDVMRAVNLVSQQDCTITIKQVDAIIDALVERKGSWADFVSAVEEASGKMTPVQRAINSLVKNQDAITADEWATLEALVAARK